MDLRNKVPFFMNYASGYMDTVSGVSPLLLPKAKANSLQYVKAFGGTEQRNLPSGYTQYEYLRSTGTQYIDLGYKGNGNTKVEVKFKYHTVTSATGSGRVFGSRITAQNNAFAIGTSSGVVASTNNKIFWCYDGQPFFVDDTEFGLDVWKTVVFSATEHTINGVTIGDDYTVTTFETPNNLKLFAFDNNGTIGVGYVDIAYCQLWNDGVLVRDVVPAGDGTTYGMYDRVSGTMLPNAGTGDFAAGPAVVPTPDEPIDIVSNNGVIKYSANMANVNAQTVLTGYYISSSGVLAADANNWIYQAFIPVKPNTTYTLSLSSAVYFVSISEYATTDDSGFIVRNAGSTGENTSLTITTSATTNFVRFGTNIDRTEVTLEEVLAINWMLNEGGTAIPYAPYVEGGIYTYGTVETIEDTIGNTATAEMLLKVGDYQDTQSIIDGVVTRNIGIKVLDGTENIGKSGTYAGSFFVRNVVSDWGTSNNSQVYCSHFSGVTEDTDYAQNKCMILNNAFNMWWASDRTLTVAQFQQWLADQYAAGTPVIVIYPLQTATTETVTGQTLQVQAGNNTLEITQASISDLTLEAVYKRSR